MKTYGLVFWVLGLSWGIALFAGEDPRVALLLDQPAGVVLEMGSGIAAEVADRIARGKAGTPRFSLTLLFPTEDGQIVDFHGKPVTLDGFQTLWIHQGDSLRTDGPLFSAGVLEKIRQYSEVSDKRPVILLTGGAVTILSALKIAEVDASNTKFGDDRVQVGWRPTGTGSLWQNLQSDRGIFWFTNAVFWMFDRCRVTSSMTETIAEVPEGSPANTFTITTHGKGVFWGLPWSFSNLYFRADEQFRSNTEAFLAAICTWQNTPEAISALTTPKTATPGFETAPLERLLEASPEYPQAEAFRVRLAAFSSGENRDAAAFQALKREILLANPDLDFTKILFIQRRAGADGLPTNWTSNSSIAKSGYANTICALDIRTGETQTLYTPPNDFFVGDLELDFDAEKVLFSMPSPDGANQPWRLWEIPLNATDETPSQATLVSTIEQDDVDNYDACYLPDGGLIFCSTACFTGVPCIDGSGHVCNLYRKGADGKIRQLTIEQDHDWCPTLLANGRVMYLRWEYSDTPHAFSRILFHANPDGTNQSEYYGSGAYYPNTMFYARPLPGGDPRFVAICGGHHDLPRCGDLVLFDPSQSRRDSDGAVQRIPGWGKKVPRTTLDFPIAQTWPKFLHPYPISATNFLVSAKEHAAAPWRIYLVDTFDNCLPLCEAESLEGFSMFEPIPWKKTPRPPVIPDRGDPTSQDAEVFIADIYYGQGLPDVPRGTVRALRILTYEFAYQGMGAEPHSVGLDGPWDPKRVLGTVPVAEDGSAKFRIPANTPVAFQPLDSEGRAIQLMRSWTTAMPGEAVACTGCHEEQNSVPPPMAIPTAARGEADEIQPFYGPTRGFSFRREVQPVLDRYCVDCHEEQKVLSFRDGPVTPPTDNPSYYNVHGRFSPSYYRLRRYVRTQTKESQMEVHKPYEFQAESTHLVQLLRRGHYGVQLDHEAWNRLYTWIDLNAPFYGSWGESRNYAIAPTVQHQYERRLTLRQQYTTQTDLFADVPSDFPAPPPGEKPAYPHSDPVVSYTAPLEPPAVATKMETLELGDGVTLELVSIPGKDWSIARFEITNEQYRLFDPTHDTGIEYSDFIQFSPNEQGWLLSRDRQPVARVSYAQAMAFCNWLSQKTGRTFTLPSVEQWQEAAAGGTQTPFWFGDAQTDYRRHENLSDISNQKINPLSWPDRVSALPPWRIADTQINDRSRVSAPVGSYRPNPFGLYDVHGNVAEWTSTRSDGRYTVCGGSWYTPARWSTRDTLRTFDAGQEVFDVGFRPIVTRP